MLASLAASMLCSLSLGSWLIGAFSTSLTSHVHLNFSSFKISEEYLATQIDRHTFAGTDNMA